MREKTLEALLVQTVKSIGGLAPKFISAGFDGMPDRIVLLPHGKMAFVEVKAHGKKPRPLQVRRKSQLKSPSFSVYCLDDATQIGEMVDEIQSI